MIYILKSIPIQDENCYFNFILNLFNIIIDKFTLNIKILTTTNMFLLLKIKLLNLILSVIISFILINY